MWYKTMVTPLTASVTINETGPEPYTLVELAGEADVTGSDTLHALLQAQTSKRPGLLIIEMSALRYMDSAALQEILSAHLALGKAGGRLAIVSPHETVARVLHMTEVDRVVRVYASVADAADQPTGMR
jgi:anti-sigma B factor antagonist